MMKKYRPHTLHDLRRTFHDLFHHLFYIQFCSTTICCSASITNVLSSPIDHWPNSNFTSRSLKIFLHVDATLFDFSTHHTIFFKFFFLTQVPELFFYPTHIFFDPSSRIYLFFPFSTFTLSFHLFHRLLPELHDENDIIIEKLMTFF